MVGTRADDLLRSPIGLHFLAHVRASKGRLDAFEILGRLQTEASRFRGDYEDHVRSLQSKSADLRDVAEKLVADKASWWDALDRRSQLWLSARPNEPTQAAFAADLRPFNDETPKPLRAMWTSTMFEGSYSLWLDHPEGPDEPFFWMLTADPGARVAEIHSAAEWWAFATRHAAATPGYVFNGHGKRRPELSRVDPDWSRVSRDWDAVHLSIGGYLTAEDVTYERDGLVTELRGWNMESTVWLRWVFTSVEQLRSP